MNLEEEYSICEENILREYQVIKDGIQSNEVIICQHIGTFKQDILISIVSLLDNQLLQQSENVVVKKKLIYIVIECIQNIMFHSDKLPDNHQLAYIVIIRDKFGYRIHSSNSLETSKIYSLEEKIKEILNVKTDLFRKLFDKKIKQAQIDDFGRGGIGLITMIEKSGKNFDYKISMASENYSLFNLEFIIKNS